MNGKTHAARFHAKAFWVMLLALVCCFRAALAPEALASVEGPPIEITVANEDQQNPHVIAIPDKGLWFVVWEDRRNSADNADIYGRFVNSDGSLCGDEILITGAQKNQTVPWAAYRDTSDDSGDTILVVWQDARGAVNSGYVYYRSISLPKDANPCTGYVLGATTAVGFNGVKYYNDPADDTDLQPLNDQLRSRRTPKVVYDPINDLFLIAWIESRDIVQASSQICFGLMNPIWFYGDSSFPGYVKINADTLAEMPSELGVVGADLIRNGEVRTDRLIAVSRTEFAETYEYEYFTNIKNITMGTDTTSPETIFVWEGARRLGTVTCSCTDNDDSATCNAGDSLSSAFTSEDLDDGLTHIYSMFTKEFFLPSTFTERIDSSDSPTYAPSIDFDSNSRFLVAWEDLREGANTKIYGQLVSSGGGLYNTNFIISYQDTNNDGEQDDNLVQSKQTAPNVSFDGTNSRFFITWQDGRNSSVSQENLDIYGQFVDSEGSMRGANNPISIAPANQMRPVTAYSSANHEFLTVWKDARNYGTTYSDIYGQRFSLGQPQLLFLNLDNTPLVPPLLDFGQLTVGESSVQSIKVKNTGDVTVHIDCVTTLPEPSEPSSAPFYYSGLPVQLEECDGSSLDLIPSGEYALRVGFAPSTGGTFIYNFTVTSDANSPTVFLQGIGVENPPASANITVSPTSVAFADTKVGDKQSLNLTFTNTGGTAVTITDINLVDDFSASPSKAEPKGGRGAKQSSADRAGKRGGDRAAASSVFAVTGISAGDTLEPGSPITALVTFTPGSAMTYGSSLHVLYDSGVVASVIPFAGTGTGGPGITVSPTTVEFADTPPGQTLSDSLTITNSGDVAITVAAIDLIPAGVFNYSGVAPDQVIAPGTSLRVGLTFAPTDETVYSATLRLLYDWGLSPSEIVLSGKGAVLIIAPSSFAFPATKIGSTASEQITIMNSGAEAKTISGVSLGTSTFAISGIAANDTVQPGQTLAGTVSFSPNQTGSYTDTLTITIAGEDKAREFALSGTGISDKKVDTFHTNTSDIDRDVVIQTITDKEGYLFILLKHQPLTGTNTVSYTAAQEYKWFAKGETTQPDWATQYYSDAPASVQSVDLGTFTNWSKLGGVLSVEARVVDNLNQFDFSDNSLVKGLDLIIHTFAGEWVVTDTIDGVDHIHPDHLIVKDARGEISATWGAYNPTIKYGTGDGYIIQFNYSGYLFTYKITFLDDTKFEGTRSYTDGQQTSPSVPTRGVKVIKP